MKLERGVAVMALLGVACSSPVSRPPPVAARPDRPVIHAATVHGPFEDEAAICRTIYSGGPDCLRRTNDLVAGPKRAAGGGFGRVEIVDAWGGDHRCAVLFEIAGRYYVHTEPSFCLSQGHTIYMPTIRDLAVRELDGRTPPDVAIVADVAVGRDEIEGAPEREEDPIPPLTIAMFCGRRAGASPSCIEVTTNDPEGFLAAHDVAFR